MTIAAILPCRGRHEQTVVNVRRLLATAGVAFDLIAVAGTDERILLDSLESFGVRVVRSPAPRLSYWQALALATEQTDAPLLVNLANDLVPGMYWLRRVVEGFSDGIRMLGFNGDSHEVGHSCHFMIDRALLDRYGGWPVWYAHNFGDTELCQRAIADGVYAKAPWAMLFHDHPYFGGADDQVYAEGRATASDDEQLFHERRRQGWPRISRANTTAPSGRAISAALG